jgi:hypothetical protein
MTSDEPAALLRAIRAALEAASIPYMVVGSFASTAHGKPRTTQDLDIVIDPTAAALDRFWERSISTSSMSTPMWLATRCGDARCST